jgi:putative ABC transport system substrate-binding protein
VIARRSAIAAIGLALAGAAPFALAQQQPRTWRIAYLGASNPETAAAVLDVFRSSLRTLGYVEGRNVILEYGYANNDLTRLPQLAEDLARLKPDVMLVHSTPASVAAKRASGTIPLVMVGVADPVGVGLVPSLARPGGNLTGVTNLIAELGGKRLELLREILPKVSQVAILLNPDDPNADAQVRYATIAARNIGVKLGPITAVRGAADLEAAFASVVKSGAGAAIRMVDPLLAPLRKQTAELAAKHRLPVVYPFREDVAVGGLVSYGANLPAQFGIAAALADKILRGAKPADLPIQQPTQFELAVNLKAAKALGITIPQTVLLRADQVIE